MLVVRLEAEGRPPCVANHPGHRTGAHATRVHLKGARATHGGAYDTRRRAQCPCAPRAEMEWLGSMPSPMHMATWGGRWWMT